MKKRILVFWMACCPVIVTASSSLHLNQEALLVPLEGRNPENAAIARISGNAFCLCWQEGYEDVVYRRFQDISDTTEDDVHPGRFSGEQPLNPVVSCTPEGGAFAVWQFTSQSPVGMGYRSMLFDSSGNALSDSSIFGLSNNLYSAPPVAASLNGNRFVAFWLGLLPGEQQYHVFAQWFDPSGRPEGSPNPIDSGSLFVPVEPESVGLASFDDGGVAVLWLTGELFPSSIRVRLFSASGEPLGKEHILISGSLSSVCPKTAALRDDRFVVCWQKEFPGDIFFQLFDKRGTAVSPERKVETPIRPLDGGYRDIAVCGLSSGGFAVAWTAYDNNASNTSVFIRAFDASGDPLYDSFRLDDPVSESASHPVFCSQQGRITIVYNKRCLEWPFGMQGICAKMLRDRPMAFPLKPFRLVEPVHDQTLHQTQATLCWQTVSDSEACFPGELQYEIRMSREISFSNLTRYSQEKDTSLLVDSLEPGTTYFWKVLAKNIAGDSLWSSETNAFFVAQDAVSGLESEERENPAGYALRSNYPNPFNAETVIRFDLASSGFAEIGVYDVRGRRVRMLSNEMRNAGSHSVRWDGKDAFGNAVPSGIYICRMEARSAGGRRFAQSVKMGLVR
jgi:hypothetical protein